MLAGETAEHRTIGEFPSSFFVSPRETHAAADFPTVGLQDDFALTANDMMGIMTTGLLLKADTPCVPALVADAAGHDHFAVYS